ncbi:MAG: hypothetical protein ACE5IK_09735, partial [Acidobacteriota bacterium]
MSSEHRQEDRQFLARWVRDTCFGWLVGLVVIIVAGIGGDLIGAGEADSQFIIGLGMGAGVGYAQGRVVKCWLGAARDWTWTSVIGIGLPFVVFDFAGAIWSRLPDVPRLELEVAISGLLVGALQRRVLSLHSSRANWWVPACVAGWTLAAATAASGSLL